MPEGRSSSTPAEIEALISEEILRVHDSTGALVLLDQAYVEFGGGDAIPLLEGRPRLIVLRTFSKAMALAGRDGTRDDPPGR